MVGKLMQNDLTDEEKQWMMSMLMREQSQPLQETVQSVSSGSGGGGGGGGGQAIPPPQQMQQQQQQAMQIRSGGSGGGGGVPGMNQMGNALGKKLGGSAVPASGAGSALTATEAASFTPIMAPASLATGEAAVPMMGEAIAGNVGAGSASAGAAGGSGAASGGGMMAAAGPWAALAALVIGNETYQNKQGNRPEDSGDYAKALLSGEVLEMDAEKYLSDVPGAEFMASMGNPEGIAKNIGKSLKPWEWF